MDACYQDRHPEIDCPECGGAGFFGNGPVADACGCCGGTGVLINNSVTLSARKPMRRASAMAKEVQLRGGER